MKRGAPPSHSHPPTLSPSLLPTPFPPSAAVASGNLSFATFFTIVWLGAWSFGGCVACSAMYGLCCRECFHPSEASDAELELQVPQNESVVKIEI